MSLDIRIPIGGMFGLLGLMLLVYGLITRGSEMYERSLGVNVNIWWGLVMAAFGGLMLYYGIRKRAATSPRTTDESKDR